MVFSKSLPILSLFVSDDITGGDACDAVRDDIGIIAHHTDGCLAGRVDDQRPVAVPPSDSPL